MIVWVYSVYGCAMLTIGICFNICGQVLGYFFGGLLNIQKYFLLLFQLEQKLQNFYLKRYNFTGSEKILQCFQYIDLLLNSAVFSLFVFLVFLIPKYLTSSKFFSFEGAGATWLPSSFQQSLLGCIVFLPGHFNYHLFLHFSSSIVTWKSLRHLPTLSLLSFSLILIYELLVYFTYITIKVLLYLLLQFSQKDRRCAYVVTLYQKFFITLFFQK